VLCRQQPRKKITRQAPDPEKSQFSLARLLRANECEEGPSSEYICIDKDANYPRCDVGDPAVGIFRTSACASLSRLASATLPERLKVIFHQFHDEVFVTGFAPAIAVDTADQQLAIVVDLD
jgi:hypothetical protein